MLHKSVLVREGLVDLTSGRIPHSDEYWGRIEFVPSKLVDPTGSRLCSFAEWPAVLDDVLTEIHSHVKVLTEPEDFKLRRVDISRDFDEVHDLAPYGHAAFARPMSYATCKSLWTNASPTTESVYAGTQWAGHTLLYDRYPLHADVVPKGRVRMEVRGLEGWVRNAALNTLGDLTTETALAFLAERWDWFGGGVPIVGQDRLLDAADALTDDDGTEWSTAKKERYLGHMWKVSRGVAEPIPSARKAEYRRAMARTGIYITGTDLDPVWNRRLDLATGYEICDVRLDLTTGTENLKETW